MSLEKCNSKNLGEVIDEALVTLRELAFYHDAVNIAYHAGQVYENQNRPKKATEFYDKAISLSRLHYEFYADEGCLDICRDIKKDIKEFKNKRDRLEGK